MTRLRHSPEGYKRMLQISSASLFILVEGPSDVYFYSRAAAAVRSRAKYEVRMARDLPGGTGGKEALLGYYDYLRRSGKLCAVLAGKPTAVVFCLDKDVDDIRRTRRRSVHIVYTAYYERENYVYAHGAVVDALAAVLHVEPSAVEAALPLNWREAAASAWREWMIVCIITRVLNVNAENFGVLSCINAPCDAVADECAFEERLTRIRTAAALDMTSFDALRRRITRLVDVRLASGRGDTIFRGKWYGAFLRHWLRGVASKSWSDRELEAAVEVSLDYTEPWCAPLRKGVRTVIDACALADS